VQFLVDGENFVAIGESLSAGTFWDSYDMLLLWNHSSKMSLGGEIIPHTGMEENTTLCIVGDHCHSHLELTFSIDLSECAYHQECWLQINSLKGRQHTMAFQYFTLSICQVHPHSSR
jgi:hypothetical protein